MIHYFYGLAANPLTLAHQKIVKDLLDESSDAKVYLAITDHEYKDIEIPFDVRKKTVEENFKDEIKAGRVVVLKQDERTYRFLSSLWSWMDYIVIGTDEWDDLKAGKWEFSTELMNTWKFKIFTRKPGAISSTEARKHLQEGASYEEVSGLISQTTYDLLASSGWLHRG